MKGAIIGFILLVAGVIYYHFAGSGKNDKGSVVSASPDEGSFDSHSSQGRTEIHASADQLISNKKPPSQDAKDYLAEIAEAEESGVSGVELGNRISEILRRAMDHVPRGEFPILLEEVRDPTSWMLLADEFVALCVREKNLDLIADWITQLDGTEKSQVIGRAARYWAETDFQAALSYVVEVEDDGARRNGLIQAFIGSGLNDYAAIVESARGELGLPWSSFRGMVLEGVLSRLVWSEGDFSSSVALIQDANADGVAVNSMIPTVAQAWAEKAPEECAAWVASLPDNLSRTGVETLLRKWIQLDPTEASEWAASLPAGTARDGAALSIANHILPNDPEGAMAWVQRIDNATVRDQWLLDKAEQLGSDVNR